MRIIRSPIHGDRIDATSTAYPSDLTVYTRNTEAGDRYGTAYGYVVAGNAGIRAQDQFHDVAAGSFFAVPGTFSIELASENARIVVVQRYGFLGMLAFGKIEERGRLSYIDGCSDSMLVYPPRLGDPVFNHLHFPPGIVQTQHTHPTIRLGIVARGRGEAFGPVKLGKPEQWFEPLTPGCVFLLEPQEMHSFRTDRDGDTMDVIAYHPDSDWGPTDTAHPMRNRTYIGANPFNTGG